MYNAIRGKAIEITDSTIVILTDGGVEYILEVSQNTSSYFRSMTSEQRKSVRVLCDLLHREDAMTLYGFYDEKERLCFRELQTVSGIGPKAALKILSGITVDSLVRALDMQDVKKLSKVPGLGAKTAQKLILQLRDVLVFEDESTRSEGKGSSNKVAERFNDFISSFTEMGYDKKNVVKAIETILEENKNFEGMDDREIEGKIFSVVIRRLS